MAQLDYDAAKTGATLEEEIRGIASSLAFQDQVHDMRLHPRRSLSSTCIFLRPKNSNSTCFLSLTFCPSLSRAHCMRQLAGANGFLLWLKLFKYAFVTRRLLRLGASFHSQTNTFAYRLPRTIVHTPARTRMRAHTHAYTHCQARGKRDSLMYLADAMLLCAPHLAPHTSRALARCLRARFHPPSFCRVRAGPGRKHNHGIVFRCGDVWLPLCCRCVRLCSWFVCLALTIHCLCQSIVSPFPSYSSHDCHTVIAVRAKTCKLANNGLEIRQFGQ